VGQFLSAWMVYGRVLMLNTTILVAVDIGTCKTCLAVAEVNQDHSLKILGITETPSQGVRHGEISHFHQARESLKTVIVEAEELCDLKSINNVYLSITGSHIQGVNCKGTYRIPENEHEVTNVHLDEVEEIAMDSNLSRDRVYIHNTLRHYELDGHHHDVPPLLLPGRTLSAEYHSIHGVSSRIEASIRCVRENMLELERVASASLVSALMALEKNEKESGSLVIDVGAGATDYILYLDGAIAASGCIPVGGDCVTHGIHVAAHITLTIAEQLKIYEGDASGAEYTNVGMVSIGEAENDHDAQVPRRLLNQVIHTQMKETLEEVCHRLPEGALEQVGTGVYLTGGASQQRGLADLAHQIFHLPVYQPEAGGDSSSANPSIWSPKYSTVMGLLRYAQLMEADKEERSWIKKLLRVIWPWGS